jgi:hypothetical protein
VRTYWTRSGRYRGHSEGCIGLAARALGGLILLGWPWALGIGWAAWLIAVPWYAILAAAWYGTTRKDIPRKDVPMTCGSCGCEGPGASGEQEIIP